MSLSAMASDAVTMLENFNRTVQAASGKFKQVSIDKSGKISEQTTVGEFLFSRPGKFIWKTVSPFEQQIVSNGKVLWLYDPDLYQVTKKDLLKNVSSTPASILFGSGVVKDQFRLSSVAKKDDLAWVRAIPLKDDIAYKDLEIGFSEDGGLKVLRLNDSFGEATEFRFESVDLHPEIQHRLFEFTPPAGVDIIEDKTSF